MLNTFPDLLTYSFFAPTLLRIAAALMFFYLARVHYQRKEEIGRTHFIIVGRRSWLAWKAIIPEVVVGLMLLFGYYTQIAAIIGLVIAFKQLAFAKRYPIFAPLTRPGYLLLCAVCLSLLLTGAGAIAFDLRL